MSPYLPVFVLMFRQNPPNSLWAVEDRINFQSFLGMLQGLLL